MWSVPLSVQKVLREVACSGTSQSSAFLHCPCLPKIVAGKPCKNAELPMLRYRCFRGYYHLVLFHFSAALSRDESHAQSTHELQLRVRTHNELREINTAHKLTEINSFILLLLESLKKLLNAKICYEMDLNFTGLNGSCS